MERGQLAFHKKKVPLKKKGGPLRMLRMLAHCAHPIVSRVDNSRRTGGVLFFLSVFFFVCALSLYFRDIRVRGRAILSG